MSSLSMLIRNENMKIYRRPRTWVMIAFLILTVALLSGMMKWDEREDNQPNWEQNLTQENAHIQKQLVEIKDLNPDHKAYLTEQIKLNEYYLEHDINPNDLQLWDYVNNSASLTILVTLLTVIIAADMIAAEFSWGTIKLLLVGPASRTKILVSKYVATMGFALLLLLICFAAAFAAGGILEGFSGVNQPYLSIDADNVVQESSMIVHALQKYGFAIVSLILYVMMAFMISAAFRSSSMAIAFSLLFMLVGTTLTALLSEYSWVKYLLFANIDLTQYLAGASPIRPDMTLSFSIMMLIGYYLVFQFVAWLLFTKRDVAA
ncbi:ABC transporter permease [Paenibacillus oenotherae]|uniref:ABC transporter permease n=1 Tax=Paenibacillus oenotherae TaxID=1435645 RepID=A0ABS7D1X3_9BACL|nr:ABC transporter permease [Paenibacillus oenotherae]MBW7473866.1 ABC transporter permease [Paenibacillus oenotherae]